MTPDARLPDAGRPSLDPEVAMTLEIPYGRSKGRLMTPTDARNFGFALAATVQDYIVD